jgi:hypothetical protein
VKAEAKQNTFISARERLHRETSRDRERERERMREEQPTLLSLPMNQDERHTAVGLDDQYTGERVREARSTSYLPPSVCTVYTRHVMYECKRRRQENNVLATIDFKIDAFISNLLLVLVDVYKAFFKRLGVNR